MSTMPKPDSTTQLQLPVTKPREPSFAEGNLGELPLFVLNRNDARPTLTKDLVRTVDLGVGADGKSRRITVEAGASTGFPTMFGALVLQVIIERALEQGLTDGKVEITRHRIARRLGYRRPQASDLDRINKACEKLAGVRFKLENTWWHRAPRTPAQTGGATSTADRDAGQLAPKGEEALAVMPHGRLREIEMGGLLDTVRLTASGGCYVTLGERLFESIKNRYIYPLGLDYLVALRSPVAQRIYMYLAKKDDTLQFVEYIKSFGRKVGLNKTAPSAILAALGPALDRLKDEIEVHPPDGQAERHRFLASWVHDKRSGNLTFVFFREKAPSTTRPDGRVWGEQLVQGILRRNSK